MLVLDTIYIYPVIHDQALRRYQSRFLQNRYVVFCFISLDDFLTHNLFVSFQHVKGQKFHISPDKLIPIQRFQQNNTCVSRSAVLSSYFVCSGLKILLLRRDEEEEEEEEEVEMVQGLAVPEVEEAEELDEDQAEGEVQEEGGAISYVFCPRLVRRHSLTSYLMKLDKYLCWG